MEDWHLIALTFSIFLIWAFISGSKAPRPYRTRKCSGKIWKQSFPNSSKENIRLYLLCFVDGMAFDLSEKLKFQPDDKIIDVYKSIYNDRIPRGDDMECETFAENIAKEFTIELDLILSVWNENTTLGELFEFVESNTKSTHTTSQLFLSI